MYVDVCSFEYWRFLYAASQFGLGLCCCIILFYCTATAAAEAHWKVKEDVIKDRSWRHMDISLDSVRCLVSSPAHHFWLCASASCKIKYSPLRFRLRFLTRCRWKNRRTDSILRSSHFYNKRRSDHLRNFREISRKIRNEKESHCDEDGWLTTQSTAVVYNCGEFIRCTVHPGVVHLYNRYRFLEHKCQMSIILTFLTFRGFPSLFSISFWACTRHHPPHHTITHLPCPEFCEMRAMFIGREKRLHVQVVERESYVIA